jgi:hypothetical protein
MGNGRGRFVILLHAVLSIEEFGVLQRPVALAA